MIGLDERLFDYAWSSYPLYASQKGRSAWFEPRTVLGELGSEGQSVNVALFQSTGMN